MDDKEKLKDIEIGKEIGFLIPLKILPKTSLGVRVECVCRCGALVKREISNLRHAVNNFKKPACKKCIRKVIKANEFRWRPDPTDIYYSRK